jgi:hypothetical protein
LGSWQFGFWARFERFILLDEFDFLHLFGSSLALRGTTKRKLDLKIEN